MLFYSLLSLILILNSLLLLASNHSHASNGIHSNITNEPFIDYKTICLLASGNITFEPYTKTVNVQALLKAIYARYSNRPASNSTAKENPVTKPTIDGTTQENQFSKPTGDGTAKENPLTRTTDDGTTKENQFIKPTSNATAQENQLTKASGDAADVPIEAMTVGQLLRLFITASRSISDILPVLKSVIYILMNESNNTCSYNSNNECDDCSAYPSENVQIQGIEAMITGNPRVHFGFNLWMQLLSHAEWSMEDVLRIGQELMCPDARTFGQVIRIGHWYITSQPVSTVKAKEQQREQTMETSVEAKEQQKEKESSGAREQQPIGDQQSTANEQKAKHHQQSTANEQIPIANQRKYLTVSVDAGTVFSSPQFFWAKASILLTRVCPRSILRKDFLLELLREPDEGMVLLHYGNYVQAILDYFDAFEDAEDAAMMAVLLLFPKSPINKLFNRFVLQKLKRIQQEEQEEKKKKAVDEEFPESPIIPSTVVATKPIKQQATVGQQSVQESAQASAGQESAQESTQAAHQATVVQESAQSSAEQPSMLPSLANNFRQHQKTIRLSGPSGKAIR